MSVKMMINVALLLEYTYTYMYVCQQSIQLNTFKSAYALRLVHIFIAPTRACMLHVT